jgi:hypothetical protein
MEQGIIIVSQPCHVKPFLPGIRYCMFIASSFSRSPLRQIAAAENKMAETSVHPTPIQATMYDQS